MPPSLDPLHRCAAYVAGRRGKGDHIRSIHGIRDVDHGSGRPPVGVARHLTSLDASPRAHHRPAGGLPQTAPSSSAVLGGRRSAPLGTERPGPVRGGIGGVTRDAQPRPRRSPLSEVHPRRFSIESTILPRVSARWAVCSIDRFAQSGPGTGRRRGREQRTRCLLRLKRPSPRRRTCPSDRGFPIRHRGRP
jgi:hypothetical protein